ncbi:hypothetical protein [Brachybacterium sp. sponge]|nr:hypothetical protein [Brachybacterium sp. sponge]
MRPPDGGRPYSERSPAVLDVLSVVGVIALFAVVALIARAVEKL